MALTIEDVQEAQQNAIRYGSAWAYDVVAITGALLLMHHAVENALGAFSNYEHDTKEQAAWERLNAARLTDKDGN